MTLERDHSLYVPRDTPLPTVTALALDPEHRFSKLTCNELSLIAGHGIKGDAHAGPFVKHRYLARRNPRQLNLRQVHLLPVELLRALSQQGFDVAPGQLGENITTEAIDLERLSVGTKLAIGAQALIELTGLRTPCVLIDRFKPGLKQKMIRTHAEVRYRAGVLGIVRESGQIRVGDPIRVSAPRWSRRSAD